MTTSILFDLIDFLKVIHQDDYVKPSVILSGATIGQHVRHSIEMYQCVLSNYETSEIDYAKRKRDIVIETFPLHAIDCLKEIVNTIEKSDKALTLIDNEHSFATSYQREIHYCNEHTIHHMALIRVGIQEIGGYALDASFGVAPSTIKYRQACAQ